MFDVALFGGGFDPLGINHESIVGTIKEHTGMPTWVMPCYGHLFSKGNQLTSANHRWNMVLATVHHRRDDTFIPCRWEIDNKHSGSMYETISHLKAEYNPEFRFHIVIGMDNANLVENCWDRGNLLIQENPFIVFEREGIESTARWFLDSPHKVLPLKINLSSTAIREAIRNGNHAFAQQHLNPAVWEYIQTNGLYGYKA